MAAARGAIKEISKNIGRVDDFMGTIPPRLDVFLLVIVQVQRFIGAFLGNRDHVVYLVPVNPYESSLHGIFPTPRTCRNVLPQLLDANAI